MLSIIWIYSGVQFKIQEEHNMNPKLYDYSSPILHAGFWCLFLIFTSLIFGAAFAFGDNDDSNDTCAAPTGSTPGSYRFLSDEGITGFPFEIFHGDIRFKGEINGHEVYMLLDDGFMWDELLFWGSPRVDSLGLKYDGEFSVRGAKDTVNEVPAWTSSGITINLPGVEFTDQTAIITAYNSGVSNMWSGSVGQVSGTFLKNLVVDINFDNMMITLIDPAKFEYKGKGVEIPWKPMGFGPHSIPATIELADGRSISLELLLDLGYNDQLQISTIGEHKIDIPENSLPGILGFNIQGIATRGYFGRVNQVNIGGYKLNDVVVSYVSKEDSENEFGEMMIGLGLLSRFNLVYDYSKKRLFVGPNKNFEKPFEYNMSGILMRKDEEDNYKIVRVHDNSPAAEAGLLVDDIITHINGQPSSEYNYWSLESLMVQEGKKLTLALIRNGEEIKVSIILRRII
jgi:hypothetical protein